MGKIMEAEFAKLKNVGGETQAKYLLDAAESKLDLATFRNETLERFYSNRSGKTVAVTSASRKNVVPNSEGTFGLCRRVTQE